VSAWFLGVFFFGFGFFFFLTKKKKKKKTLDFSTMGV
jgi:hypothetical protein